MFPFFLRKTRVKAALFAGLVLLFLAGSLFTSCDQPANGDLWNIPVNAQQPSITAQPTGDTWDVSKDDEFTLTVTATSPDGGTISYQWYENTTNSTTGGTVIGTDNATLTLAKAEYTGDGDLYFYVVVTNTISDNGDGGTKTATVSSAVAIVTVIGNGSIPIYTTEDMAKIGVDDDWPLAGSYALLNDITLENWSPIGGAEAPFAGVFDGGKNKITLNSFADDALSGKTYLGIFAYVKGGSASAKAEIKNLTIDSSVNAEGTAQAVGLVAGYAELAEIENITLTGTFAYTSTSTNYVGGIAGLASGQGTLIKNSTSALTMNVIPGTSATLVSGVINYSYVGGFVGIFTRGPGIENCHYTGNITADNVQSTISGQVFVGGIAGGSYYGFSTEYNGYIADSSFTGTLIGRAKGSWTFAGGIAGTIVGGTVNDVTATTRIERCFAAGTVSVEGTSSGFPYIGGIVGYNYYGALTSQSYFDGTVIASKASDYTGGIAGYNSQASAPNNSRIEDCWSSGTVTGFNNAGGIVGQNQVNTYVRRCYSRALVKTTNGSGSGAGGITGLHASTMPDAVTACVALNPSITAAAGNNVHRITGSGSGNRSDNYAWSGMTITTGGTYTAAIGADLADGADYAEKPAQSFYVDTLGWDFTTVWKMGADGYPQLKWQ